MNNNNRAEIGTGQFLYGFCCVSQSFCCCFVLFYLEFVWVDFLLIDGRRSRKKLCIFTRCQCVIFSSSRPFFHFSIDRSQQKLDRSQTYFRIWYWQEKIIKISNPYEMLIESKSLVSIEMIEQHRNFIQWFIVDVKFIELKSMKNQIWIVSHDERRKMTASRKKRKRNGMMTWRGGMAHILYNLHDDAPDKDKFVQFISNYFLEHIECWMASK